MKQIFSILVILMACRISWADVNSLTLEQCRARILELERTVQSQQDRIENLIALLKKQKGQDLNTTETADTKKKPFDAKDGILYNGKKRNKMWFSQAYKQFADKIICIEGKYINIDENPIIKGITTKSYPKGTLIDCSSDTYQVTQLINSSEAIMSVVGKGRFVYEAKTPFHLKGFKGKFVDGQLFPYKGYFISNGTYEGILTNGAKKTIQDFIVTEFSLSGALSIDQFAEALNSGLILKRKTVVNGQEVLKEIP